MRPVNNKQDFVRRYKLGEFGNHSPSWDSVSEFLLSTYNDGPVHLRNRVAGGETWYNVNRDDVWFLAKKIAVERLASLDDIYVSAMAPTELTTIQGEVYETATGELAFYHSRVPLPMRPSLIDGGRQAFGLQAKILLRHYLNPRSYGWLQWLLGAYPRHVIELSCYSRCWGTEPGFNTVFWEVRNY